MKSGYKYSWTEMKILSQNWKKFAEVNGGKSHTKNVKSFGNFDDPKLRKFELRIPHNKGEIVFNTDEFRPLKISFEFKKITKDEFLIYPEDFTDKIGKFFGIKEFEIGDDKFDPKFMIRGNNKELIIRILNDRIKKYLLNNYISNFKLFSQNSKSIIELNIVINELDYNEMQDILDVFKELVTIVEKQK